MRQLINLQRKYMLVKHKFNSNKICKQCVNYFQCIIFYFSTERLAKENTLDLHFYHLDEAVSAVNLAIMLKEEGRSWNK